MEETKPTQTGKTGSGVLDLIEWIGNKLPDPAMLFVIGAVVVMVCSHLAVRAGWTVQPQVFRSAFEFLTDADGRPIVDAETGAPRIRVLIDDEGQPVLELVSDARVVTRRMRESRDANGDPVVDPQTGRAVTEPVLDADGVPIVVLEGEDRPTAPIEPVSLFTSDGLYWCLDSMVANFMGFAPLGVVLTGMLGIGVAERTGLIGALLKAVMLVVPVRMLTPTMVLMGILSSIGLDAGYVVLPPLAAALYKSVGRSPLAGIAAVFAGVAAGFNANLVVTGLDPMLSALSTGGAQIIDPGYEVAATCNWWFMIASTFVMTFAGWGVTSWFVERRFNTKSVEEGGPAPISADELAGQRLTPEEMKGLAVALAGMALIVGLAVVLTFIEGSPLYGNDGPFAKWVQAIVPLIFLSFLLPGLAYGVMTGTVHSGKDATKLMTESLAAMAPIIVLAFFASQFIEYFKYSHLDRMLAMAGGQALAAAELSNTLLLVAFILVTMVFNLFVGSMSAKYTMFASIFVPMFMMVGISPELTQATYRIGDSVSNVITPLNPYLVILLVFMQKYVSKAGMGTLISMMIPYTVVFAIVWTILLVVWVQLGIPLGPGGPLVYVPTNL